MKNNSVEYLRINSSGVSMAKSSMVRAYLASNQTITNNVVSTVNLTSESFDSLSEWSGSTFTATYTGYYRVTFQVLWDDVTTSGSRVIYLYKNGAEYSQHNSVPLNTQKIAGQLNDVVSLTAGDTLSVRVLQSSGSDLTAVGSASGFFTFITINRIY
jgi:hypothetical protein